MNFYNIKAIASSGKSAYSMKAPLPSFFVSPARGDKYVEPSFEKRVFDTEQPTVLLISAVGASGKSALANVLSHEAKMPLLDLAKHPPVGANTLTGALTNAYELSDMSGILQGLANGSFGVVIDGIDEGRSKTTASAFAAFLDDIAMLCKASAKTTIVMLGRSKTVDDVWIHLEEKGVSTGIVSILPFTLEKAREYIDKYVGQGASSHNAQYIKARDFILDKLKGAFAPNKQKETSDFLSFIGYPPVLDAITTLLKTEKNYHALIESFSDVNDDASAKLIYAISKYILERERTEKVIPNIVAPLAAAAIPAIGNQALDVAFKPEEQCRRLISYCLKEPHRLEVIADPVLNGQYEQNLESFLSEHPFLDGDKFRNVVFEALAMAVLINSEDPQVVAQLQRYAAANKPSYHLIYMTTAHDSKTLPSQNIHLLLSSAMEFRSVHSVVELTVEAPHSTGLGAATAEFVHVDINISVDDDEASADELSFSFTTQVSANSRVELGRNLSNIYVAVPCEVSLTGRPDVELAAPCTIEAEAISLTGDALVVRAEARKDGTRDVALSAQKLMPQVQTVDVIGADLTISLEERSGIGHPTVRFIQDKKALPKDPLVMEKYFRLKRILMEFRSHSKGSLAKYKHKIEHERVLRNEIGQKILARLVADGVLYLNGNFYHVNPDAQAKHLGASWQDLRRGAPPESLLTYLRSIN